MAKKIRLFFILGAIIILALAVLHYLPNWPALGPSTPYRLTILHTSENHGHWEPVDIAKVSQGGIARRATMVNRFRAEAPNTLLLDSGDISQGTLYYALYKGSEGRDFYNLLGYDAVVPGNHEFDLGVKTLAENFLQGSRFSVVLANMDFTAEPLLADKIPPSVIKNVNGEKIGIFGLVTDEVIVTSSPGPNIKMKDTVQAAREAVAELSRQSVNKIILLSHLGFPADKDLAARVDGIDVIVSGHTDTLMGEEGMLNPSLGPPETKYPVVVNSPSGGRTLIVHAFIWGRLLGRLNLVFNNRGEILSWDGQPVFVDDQVPEESAVAQKLAEMKKPLDELRKQVIGVTKVDINGERAIVRNQESNLGNLVADAMLWATRHDRTQVAFANGGGIRASIKRGDISYGQVLEALPFANRLVQFDLTGDELVKALENGISQVNNAKPQESAGRFPQVGGMKFVADLAKPAGSRVREVWVGNTPSGYKRLDSTAVYRIVTLDFMFGGGDGYSMFNKGKNVRGGDVPQEMVVIEYIKANSPISPEVEGRIELIKP